MTGHANRYSQLLEAIFEKHYTAGMNEIVFERSELIDTAAKLGIALPKNLGDVVYSFRYRTELPPAIVARAKEGFEWIIRPAGRGRYVLALARNAVFVANEQLAEVKIPDATPGIISKYAFSDEQALLAMLRYNRLIDIFTGLTCYSLQNHLRTTVRDIGQVETDEIYIGLDKRGVHFVLPIQAKGGRDKLGIVQIEQDFMLCAEKFKDLVCRPVAAQFMDSNLIALFEFVDTKNDIRIGNEKHYRLVSPDDLSVEELEAYKTRP